MAGSVRALSDSSRLAEERGDAWPDDAKRPLTRRGHGAHAEVGPRPGAARRGVRCGADEPARPRAPDRRHRRRGARSAPSIVDVESLAPERHTTPPSSPISRNSAKRAASASSATSPAIGELAARLVGSRHPFEFKKGAVCRIDVDAMPPGGPGEPALAPDAEDPQSRRKVTPEILSPVRPEPVGLPVLHPHLDVLDGRHLPGDHVAHQVRQFRVAREAQRDELTVREGVDPRLQVRRRTAAA